MEYADRLWLLLWDKGALALGSLVIGALLNNYLSRRSRLDDRNAIARDDLARRKREASLQRIDAQIAFLERRLDALLWPLTLCLRIDDVIWKKIPGLHADATNLPTAAGKLVEAQALLPNHERAVELIEKHFHLIAHEDDLIRPLVDYVQHVAILRALRAAGVELNPVDVDARYPPRLSSAVHKVLTRSIEELGELKTRRAEQAAALAD